MKEVKYNDLTLGPDVVVIVEGGLIRQIINKWASDMKVLVVDIDQHAEHEIESRIETIECDRALVNECLKEHKDRYPTCKHCCRTDHVEDMYPDEGEKNYMCADCFVATRDHALEV